MNISYNELRHLHARSKFEAPTGDKEKARAEIERQVSEFQASGGQIVEVPSYVHGPDEFVFGRIVGGGK